MWSALFLTLPTRPNAVRLRVWRTLKTLGCGALRDGVYLLPADRAAQFEAVVTDVQAHGGQACVLDLSARDAVQAAAVLALFDRSAAYGLWRVEAQALSTALPALQEVEARRRWRAVADTLQAIQHTDFYAGAANQQAQAELGTLRQALDRRYIQGEPVSRAPHGIARLDPRKFQGRLWATRARPGVDRLACAWLIRRHIDRQARFVWLPDPAASTPAPRGALGFDFDGARFTHVGARVSFEVLAASFGLDTQPRLQHIARTVHYLDVGGIPVAEAAGLQAVLAGLSEVHADDDELAAAAALVFDALHAAPGVGA
jgi:hypothetical protein